MNAEEGQVLEAVLHASDSAGRIVRGGSGIVRFWAPGTAPPDPPACEFPLAWVPALRGYRCEVPTAGWPLGAWRARGQVISDAGTAGWSEWLEFTLSDAALTTGAAPG